MTLALSYCKPPHVVICKDIDSLLLLENEGGVPSSRFACNMSDQIENHFISEQIIHFPQLVDGTAIEHSTDSVEKLFIQLHASSSCAGSNLQSVLTTKVPSPKIFSFLWLAWCRLVPYSHSSMNVDNISKGLLQLCYSHSLFSERSISVNYEFCFSR